MIDGKLEAEIISKLESIQTCSEQRYKFKHKKMDFEDYARVLVFTDTMYNTMLEVRIK